MGCMRIPILLLAVAICSGCATAHHTQRLADVGRDQFVCRTGVVAAPPLDSSQAPGTRPSILNLNLRCDKELRTAFWDPGEAHGLTLAGEDSNSGATPEPATETNPFSKSYWKLVLADVKETFTAPARWDKRDWLIFGGVVAGIGTVAVFDEDIQRAVQRNRNGTLNDISNAIQPFGQEYVPGVLGAFYLGGAFFNDERAKVVALDGASASIIASGLILYPLKYAVGRSRPGDNRGAYHFQPFGGSDSFPSGHTTEAFVLATVIAEHYDSIWIKIGSYGVASMVGYARMNNNYHWASDVLAGAAIGTFVSHVVVHYNQKHWRVAFQPIIGPNLQGGQFTYRF